MARDPQRYTVMDIRSLRSIRELGLLAPGWANATEHDWLGYLGSCRTLSATTGQPLRAVDRALYKANGRTGLP